MAVVAMAQLAVPLSMPMASASVSASTQLRARASFSGQALGLPVLAWARVRPARGVVCAATKEEEKEQRTKEEEKLQPVESKSEPDADSVTRKFGLEAGLWKIWSAKEGGVEEGKGTKGSQAKELLKRYGGAYLATSISLSLVSFALCYVLVQSGVDVPTVLEKVGIHVNETGEKVGTFALAYAAHKALSPVRFPPTVALTPIVAAWFGKKPEENASK